jgi:hypothetical protein
MQEKEKIGGVLVVGLFVVWASLCQCIQSHDSLTDKTA